MRTDQTRPILPRGGFQFAGGAGEVRPQQRKALWCADRNSWEPGSIIRRTRERATDMRKSLGAVATALFVLGSVALTASAASAGTPSAGDDAAARDIGREGVEIWRGVLL